MPFANTLAFDFPNVDTLTAHLLEIHRAREPIRPTNR